MRESIEQALPRCQPEAEGLAAAAILRFVEAVESQMHEMHSFMLLRHGRVVAEGWWAPYRPEDQHLLFSVSKSFTATAVGLAVAEGRLSIEAPLLSFFPEERPAASNDFLASMTVRHLLTMTTGHAVDTWPFLVARADGDWIKAFLSVPVVHAPGTHFLYNTGASYILAAIVQQATGMKLIDYLQPRLFEPLGIQHATWQESPQGIAVGGYGLSLTTEELARFGQLYLQKGRWGERQILAEAWVEAATSAQVSNGNNRSPSDWSQGYGYQFWCARHGAYQASGVFGQGCLVLPQQEAVLAFTGGIDVLEVQQLLDLVWTLLLPAFEPDPPAAEAVSQNKLAERLSGLTLAPVPNPAALAMPAQATERSYVVDANALNLETIALNLSRSGGQIRFQRPGAEDTLVCDQGEWRPGRTNLFNQLNGPWLSDDPLPVATSGGWASPDCFTMVVRLLETPFFYSLACYFIDDELLLEIRGNVTLDAPKTLALTAHLKRTA